MDLSALQMEKLADLLRAPEPEVLQGEDFPATNYEVTSNRDTKVSQNQDVSKYPKTIEEFEQQEAEEAENMGKVGFGAGDRKTPEYTMNYQQSVSAEDVFLQMGPKTPSSASCENLVVRVMMPGDKKENVDLSVDKNSVTINSSQYYLKLMLPHEINPDNSKASWDGAKDILLLTLKLDREFDFVNF
ncbi:dynein axonemal assembly factor 6 [Danaus plexippus]|uniref:Uncharacterized protein n=1 Tax=Danaus plexippus plexippus TaxID=278856 RepID=A0A212FA44_DANPL|nr:dynein axonemal assembly factor 6 [Danaus plexippus]XP_032510726.1 protein PIH1D3 [Danaus plexippus plexippus]XP_061378988.1 dynein axonemal assembly factor 6 [Danaus plexippus]OWR50593.1 hypothetical protein KGM_211072 [Danaus plexippus plexippus]